MENMTIEEINKEIQKLEEQKTKLLNNKYKQKRKVNEEYIGKCFYHNIYNDTFPTIGFILDLNINGDLKTIELSYDENIPSLDGDYEVCRSLNKLNFITAREFMYMLNDRLQMIIDAWKTKIDMNS